jgi:predicted DNA-binding transcriptional regulator YafY
VLGDLFRAVTERRRVHFTYNESRRSLDPYGIAHRRGHWYLVGAGPHGERLYRVDRLSKLEVGEDAGVFVRPAKFDIRKVVNTHPWEAGLDETVNATVRFDPEVSWWAARTLGTTVENGKTLEVDLPVANRDAFIGWILSFGESVEVLGPAELRAEITRRVVAALENVG